MITNEQKAQQIIGCNRTNWLECGGSLSVANGCIEFERIMTIAKWKDEEHNECIKDILTLVNLIPCNEGNESIINDIKNLLK